MKILERVLNISFVSLSPDGRGYNESLLSLDGRGSR
jgi:hypothetical protein